MRVILVLVAIFIAVIVGTNKINQISCEARGSVMGLESQYGWRTGCMVRVRGQWIPLSNFRVVEE